MFLMATVRSTVQVVPLAHADATEIDGVSPLPQANAVPTPAKETPARTSAPTTVPLTIDRSEVRPGLAPKRGRGQLKIRLRVISRLSRVASKPLCVHARHAPPVQTFRSK